jgi:phosphatidyl-myo-inositol dimannoside synthase
VTAPSRIPRSAHITGLFTGLLAVGGVQEAGRLTALAIDEIARRQGWSFSLSGLTDAAGEQTLSIAGRSLAFQGFAHEKWKFVRSAMGAARAAQTCPAHLIVACHPNLAPIAVWMQKTSPRAHAIVMAHGVDVWQPLPIVRRATTRAARFVTAPSTDTLQKLIRIQRVPSDRARLLPWPLNPDFLRLTERNDLPLPSGFPEGRVILTIGRAASAEQYKGTDDLIRATAHLHSATPNLHLVAVGGGDDLPRLKALARDASITDRVHFLQGLSREEIAACYSRAEIFAMPSLGEGFGLVFLEAMSFAKPVIAAAAGGATDIVEDGVNGLLVPPRDLPALIAAIQRLLVNAQFRGTLGSQGAAIVREKYRFESFSSQFEALLKKSAVDFGN